jgi:hypothetical protein
MKGMMLTSSPNMRVLDEHPLDRAPDLSEIQGHLGGGYLERVPGFTTIAHKGEVHRCVAFADEDGKMKALPTNHYATTLWKFAGTRTNPDLMLMERLCGPVVVLYGDDEFMAAL